MSLHDKLNPYPPGFAAVTRQTAIRRHRSQLPDADQSNYPSDRVYYVAHHGKAGFSIDPFLRICNLWASESGGGREALRAAADAGSTGTCYIEGGSVGWHLFLNCGWQPVEDISTTWSEVRMHWTRFASPYSGGLNGNC